MNVGFRVIDRRTGTEVQARGADLEAEVARADWARNLVWCDLECFALGQNGQLYLLDECGNYACPPDALFEVVETEDP